VRRLSLLVIGTTTVAAPAPAAARVVGRPATPAQVRQLTAVANAHHTCGFNERADYLAHARVTNNGWAGAQINARNPALQGNCEIVFKHRHKGWRVFTAGSDLSGVPDAVRRALFP
jgi:hypothetical protein